MFISIMNPEDPNTEFYCMLGTIVRLYLNTYQLYQMFTMNAAKVEIVATKKIIIFFLESGFDICYYYI